MTVKRKAKTLGLSDVLRAIDKRKQFLKNKSERMKKEPMQGRESHDKTESKFEKVRVCRKGSDQDDDDNDDRYVDVTFEESVYESDDEDLDGRENNRKDKSDETAEYNMKSKSDETIERNMPENYEEDYDYSEEDFSDFSDGSVY